MTQRGQDDLKRVLDEMRNGPASNTDDKRPGHFHTARNKPECEPDAARFLKSASESSRAKGSASRGDRNPRL